MSNFALIGHPVGHSFSKRMFDAAFGGRHSYELIDAGSLDGVRQLVVTHRLSGFNVTVPYKQDILSILDRLTPEARNVGAVNCVRVEADGSLTGHNTDSAAFFETIVAISHLNNQAIKQSSNQTAALILGTGGAARAVAAALCSLGIEFRFVSRTPDDKKCPRKTISYSAAYKAVSTVRLIVNATPVGMIPECDATPWGCPEMLSGRHFVYDLVYNPSPTRFMREAAAAGATVKDGLEMLRLQAELSWRFWGLGGFQRTDVSSQPPVISAPATTR